MQESDQGHWATRGGFSPVCRLWLPWQRYTWKLRPLSLWPRSPKRLPSFQLNSQFQLMKNPSVPKNPKKSFIFSYWLKKKVLKLFRNYSHLTSQSLTVWKDFYHSQRSFQICKLNVVWIALWRFQRSHIILWQLQICKKNRIIPHDYSTCSEFLRISANLHSLVNRKFHQNSHYEKWLKWCWFVIRQMEDEGSYGNDDIRCFILSNLATARMSRAFCLVCQNAMIIYDRYPLIDGTFFLSPRQYSKSCIPVSYLHITNL